MNMKVYKRDNPMKSFTNEEYLELCQKLIDEQYGDEAIEDYNISDMEWMPSESEVKKKKLQANTNGMIDLTDIKASKIKDELFKCTNFKVGNFKIRINHYYGMPEEEFKLKLGVEVWEERHKTPNGMPCKIDYPMIFAKDSRFKNRPWLNDFQGGNSAYRVPIDTVVEIIRWMQAVKKLTAFI
jgi:hypothetical protein